LSNVKSQFHYLYSAINFNSKATENWVSNQVLSKLATSLKLIADLLHLSPHVETDVAGL